MRMYFRHWLFHKEQQHCEQSILSILEWTILICSTAYYSLETPSLSFPPSFSSPIFLSSSPCSIFPPLYLLPYIYDVILSSSHAKNVAVYFMSTACGRPQRGGGQWTIT